MFLYYLGRKSLMIFDDDLYIYIMKNREWESLLESLLRGWIFRTQFLIFYVIKAMMEVDKHSNTDIFILLISNILYLYHC